MSGRPQGPYTVKKRNPVVTAALQHMAKPQQIRLDVGRQVQEWIELGAAAECLQAEPHHLLLQEQP